MQGGQTWLNGKHLKGFGEAAAMPLHVVPDGAFADHPVRLAMVPEGHHLTRQAVGYVADAVDQGHTAPPRPLVGRYVRPNRLLSP
jgi:hypothetical protein